MLGIAFKEKKNARPGSLRVAGRCAYRAQQQKSTIARRRILSHPRDDNCSIRTLPTCTHNCLTVARTENHQSHEQFFVFPCLFLRVNEIAPSRQAPEGSSPSHLNDLLTVVYKHTRGTWVITVLFSSLSFCVCVCMCSRTAFPLDGGWTMEPVCRTS